MYAKSDDDSQEQTQIQWKRILDRFVSQGVGELKLRHSKIESNFIFKINNFYYKKLLINNKICRLVSCFSLHLSSFNFPSFSYFHHATCQHFSRHFHAFPTANVYQETTKRLQRWIWCIDSCAICWIWQRFLLFLLTLSVEHIRKTELNRLRYLL